MGKLLQINPVIKENTSTGRIMRELSELAKACGWESYAAFSGGRDKASNASFQPIPVGGKLNVLIHAIATRVFDAHGLASWCATKRFIKKILEKLRVILSQTKRAGNDLQESVLPILPFLLLMDSASL